VPPVEAAGSSARNARAALSPQVRENRMSRNWLCFARFGPSGSGLGDLAGPRAHPSPRGELALFDTLAPKSARACGPDRAASFPVGAGKLGSFGAMGPSRGRAGGPVSRRLIRSLQGKLGSFGAIGPSDGSAGVFAGPCPSLSVPANWVCLYSRSQRRFRR
jgi:hypothetical protein